MIAIPYLISSVMCAENDPVVINTVFDMVKPSDVGSEYGAIYAMMMDCWKRYKLIEPAGLHIEILAKYPDPKHYKKLVEQLLELWDLVTSSAFWQHYLKLSLAEIKIAKLKTVGNVIDSNVMSAKDIDEILSTTKCDIANIMDKYNMIESRGLRDITSSYLTSMDKQITGIKENKIITGLYYENYIKGFRSGDFIILAGRPKMGKSAFANSIIAKCLQEGKRIMLVNNEMDEQSIINRLMGALYEFNVSTLQEPEKMSEYQVRQLMEKSEEFADLPLHLYCFTMKTPSDIETEAIRLKEAGTPVDFIVADYLQLFRTGDKHKSLYEEISNLSWQFKMLAANLGVPVLALSQVNRKCEERPNKRPLPSDLRESGSLEQDATAVMFIYRDEVYHEKTAEPNIAEIHVAVNRNGRTGTDKYYVDFDHMRISNLTTRSEND